MIEPIWTNKILVSTPKMRSDSAFDRSVVYLYEESPQHVAGLVINKPTKTKLQRIFQVKGFKTINNQGPSVPRRTSQPRQHHNDAH